MVEMFAKIPEIAINSAKSRTLTLGFLWGY